MSKPLSQTSAVALPPLTIYPERADRPENWLDRLSTAVAGVPVVMTPKLHAGRLRRIIPITRRAGKGLKDVDVPALEAKIGPLREKLRGGQFTDEAVGEAFALICEMAGRVLGMRHFDVQLLGGFAMIKGMIAEMETGEGKTLTATLPACTAALAALPVHVVTANDYLAQRDAEIMTPLYQALGLTVGIVVHGMKPEERRAAYLCDITYCSNKELVFDYLRDRMVLGEYPSNLLLKLERLKGRDARSTKLVMRGLHFAIVDEADSVLIDEARTPFVISGQTDPADEQERAEAALELIEPFELDKHYKILNEERVIELTSHGKQLLEDIAAEEAGERWTSRIRREEAARQALAAKHLFRRDEHYIVRDGKVQIVDEYTGRVMEDRSWNDGLHQLIEVSEGCEATGQNVALARMTHQRFFRRYKNLAGMTGTAREVAGEFWTVYRLPIYTVPTNRPAKRTTQAPTIYRTSQSKWRAIAAETIALNKKGLPVLLGTRSVAASETASEYLTEAGLEHEVLNAAQDSNEAEIIAEAGQRGRITIATNMAGRGVDIKLEDDVADMGGLQVIMSELHDSARIDRQLLGRAGRQAQKGHGAAYLSLEDPLLEILTGSMALRLCYLPGAFGRLGRRLVFKHAQRKAERAHSRARKELIKMDRRLGTLLAFSGRME
ncbi:MAG: preprotein translocase subunit SecA [Pseudomonadota bacterium]